MAIALQRRRLTVRDSHRVAESGVFGDVHRHEDGMLMTMGVPVEVAALS